MRIVAGNWRGRRLVAPKGQDIRPTSDRVRQALFDVLGPLQGLVVLDLFAGSGALAFEALSRGARRAYLVDSGREARELCAKNAELLGAQSQCDFLGQSAEVALTRLAAQGVRADLAFLDPPYAQGLLPTTLAHPAWTTLLTPEARVVCERGLRTERFEVPAPFTLIDERRWGETEVWLLGLSGPQEAKD